MVSKYPHIRKKWYPLIPKNNAQKNLISALVTELAQLKFMFLTVVKLPKLVRVRVVWLTFCPEQWSMKKVMISSRTLQQTVVRNRAQARSSWHAQWGTFYIIYDLTRHEIHNGFIEAMSYEVSVDVTYLLKAFYLLYITQMPFHFLGVSHFLVWPHF